MSGLGTPFDDAEFGGAARRSNAVFSDAALEAMARAYATGEQIQADHRTLNKAAREYRRWRTERNARPKGPAKTPKRPRRARFWRRKAQGWSGLHGYSMKRVLSEYFGGQGLPVPDTWWSPGHKRRMVPR